LKVNGGSDGGHGLGTVDAVWAAGKEGMVAVAQLSTVTIDLHISLKTSNFTA
jgi:hypothetical protein